MPIIKNQKLKKYKNLVIFYCVIEIYELLSIISQYRFNKI